MPISNLGNGLRTGVCTSTNRPTTPYEGQVIYETDTDKVFVWNGTAWVIPNSPAQNPTGLELITACTVTSAGGTGATVSGGVVTIGTSNTSVTVSSAFSATYDNYRITISGGLASASGDMSLQLNGITGSVYQTVGYYITYGVATIVAFAPAVGTSFLLGHVDTTQYATTFDLISPNLTKQKFVIGQNGSSTTALYFTNGKCTSTSAATGFTITPSSGTITGGTIRVYGYRNS